MEGHRALVAGVDLEVAAAAGVGLEVAARASQVGPSKQPCTRTQKLWQLAMILRFLSSKYS